jgi:predicted HTH domain antitoxin
VATVTINIPDALADKPGFDERSLRIELACRLFDADKLTKPEASHLAGLTRDEFNAALAQRGLPWIRYTEDMLDEDLRHAGYPRIR